MNEPPPKSFTAKYNGRAHVLTTDVVIGQAFDPAKVSRPPGKTYTYKGIWDTGATNTVITAKVAHDCGLIPIGITNVETANGTRQCNVYLVSILLPNTVGITPLRVTEVVLNGDSEVLIGMDVISRGDFSVTCNDGNTLFSFRYPSTRAIDFVKEHMSNKARQKQKQRRQTRKHGK